MEIEGQAAVVSGGASEISRARGRALRPSTANQVNETRLVGEPSRRTSLPASVSSQ